MWPRSKHFKEQDNTKYYWTILDYNRIRIEEHAIVIHCNHCGRSWCSFVPKVVTLTWDSPTHHPQHLICVSLRQGGLPISWCWLGWWQVGQFGWVVRGGSPISIFRKTSKYSKCSSSFIQEEKFYEIPWSIKYSWVHACPSGPDHVVLHFEDVAVKNLGMSRICSIILWLLCSDCLNTLTSSHKLLIHYIHLHSKVISICAVN